MKIATKNLYLCEVKQMLEMNKQYLNLFLVKKHVCVGEDSPKILSFGRKKEK